MLFQVFIDEIANLLIDYEYYAMMCFSGVFVYLGYVYL